MDPFYRIDTTKLYPPFLAKLREALAVCADAGFHYVATCGLRTAKEQEAIYAQGRTLPGPIVTKSHGYQSYHCYGLAVDFCRDLDPAKPGLQPGYSDHDLKPLADACKALGLQPGFYFATIHDSPHIQWNVQANGLWLSDMRVHAEANDLGACWAMLDAKAVK